MNRTKAPVTVRHVARHAGVSPATVSRVMSDRGGVSEQTRARVLEAVAALRYTPNLAAQRLSTGRHLTIAVIVPFFTTAPVSARLNGAVCALADSPYDLIIHNVTTPEQRHACFEQIPHRRQADGVLIISLSPWNEREVESLRRAEVPVVLIDSDHPELTTLPSVFLDDVVGGRAATEHVLSLGHRRVGFVGDVSDNPFHFVWSRNRLRGYRQALEAAGLAPRPGHCAEGDPSRAGARALAREMLSAPDRPTAIVAASDTQAVGVLEAARELGLGVPERLSVIGYDDIEIAEVLGLTTMRQPLFLSGRRGMEMLLDALRGQPPEALREVLPLELVVRATTAAPSVTTAAPSV
jgi:DNA-binding LacI/PurR family transcriptional regulator